MRPPAPVSYDRLVCHPRVFQYLTGIAAFDFDLLFADFLPRYLAAERARADGKPRGAEGIGVAAPLAARCTRVSAVSGASGEEADRTPHVLRM